MRAAALIMAAIVMSSGCAFGLGKRPLFVDEDSDTQSFLNVHCGDGASNIQGNAPAVTGAVGGKLDSYTIVLDGKWAPLTAEQVTRIVLATVAQPCGMRDTIRTELRSLLSEEAGEADGQ